MVNERRNVYSCRSCHKHTVTVDVDRGFTPENIKCTRPGCFGFARSCGYPSEIDPKLPDPTHEWYSPTGGELIALPKDLRFYVERGGLMLRPRTTRPALRNAP